jgi:mono/diheme cytochrome c family protein
MDPNRSLAANGLGALFAAALVSASAAAERASPIAAGHALAREACAACHRVDRAQKPPPPVREDRSAAVPAPSFLAIARDKRNTRARLRLVITRPRHPMREQSFDRGDLDAIIAYILSLRR